MSRVLRLVRSVLATAGDWAGDGTVWAGDDPANAPKVATVNAVETGNPVFRPANLRPGTAVLTRGCSGILRVHGGDSTRRFDLSLVLAYVKQAPDGSQVVEWRILTGATALNIGDGEDFTTLPHDLPGQDLAFHLVPRTASLVSASYVEVWAAEL